MRLVAAVIAASAVLGSGLVAAPNASAATDGTAHRTVLLAGHAIVAGNDLEASSLYSRNGLFQLAVESVNITLYESAWIDHRHSTISTNVWSRDSNGNPELIRRRPDRTVLRLTRKGNLVLHTSDGTPIWQSHTNGSGRHNELIITDGGNIEERNVKGHIVWATHTTAVLLGAGSNLRSGHRLVNRWDERFGDPASIVRMTSRGDLTVRVGKCLVWHAGTHVRGSYLHVRNDGDLVIYSPRGRKVWHSGSGGHDARTWMELAGGQLTISWDHGDHVRAIYSTPITNPRCAID